MQNICLEEMQDDFSSRIDWHPVLKSSVNATGKLVGGFNPFENISKIGSSPQVGVKIKNIWNHQLENIWLDMPY